MSSESAPGEYEQASGAGYEIRQCLREECRLRFPVMAGERVRPDCPLCGGPVQVVLRSHPSQYGPVAATASKGLRLSALIDNVRSLFNVGSIFRSADGAGVEEIFLCGITATPQNAGLAKTALGAERRVPWSYFRNGLDAALHLRAQGRSLWALEGGPQAQSLFSYEGGGEDRPVVLVVGNELAGIDPDILALCERVWSIPMLGMKRSLNVAIAFGIAAYWFQRPV